MAASSEAGGANNSETALNFAVSSRSATKTTTASSSSSSSSASLTAASTAASNAAQVASLYLAHQQKQFASVMATAVSAANSSAMSTSASVSTKSDAGASADWSRRSTFTTAVGAAASHQTYSTSSVMSTTAAARRYSTSEREDVGLYSMSSVSVDLGESAAARSKHHHTFNKPDPRPLLQSATASSNSQRAAYERAGKYSNYFDHQRSSSSSSSQSNDCSGKR